MRADRLLAILLFLQQRGKTTASELAEEMEVSVRTARRDLEALAMSGVPVYPQPGRGGCPRHVVKPLDQESWLAEHT